MKKRIKDVKEKININEELIFTLQKLKKTSIVKISGNVDFFKQSNELINSIFEDIIFNIKMIQKEINENR